MALRIIVAVWLLMVVAVGLQIGAADVFSMRLLHRFSEEVNAARLSRLGGGGNGLGLPQKGSAGYDGRLLSSDLERRKMKLGPQYQYLFPSEGSKTQHLGNDFGWLHYTWIDIGSPNVSFLVAIDTGSSLLWVPCNCMECAPLSGSQYSSLDKDLKEYKPSGSTTSKFINCSHQLCEPVSVCKSRDQPCAYNVEYVTEGTSSSGFLVEDLLHLSSGSSNKSNKFVRAPIVFGCGRKQSGSYLTGVAPDGLMGLGHGNLSVLGFLAKAGLSQNSFSLCFDEDNEGRIFFGDQGIASQNTTSFLTYDSSDAYVVGVATCCVGTSCLEQTDFDVVVDSGTSFTFLPIKVYQKVVGEFSRQINATKSRFEGSPWEYCYNSSSDAFPGIEIPSVSLKFDVNNSFVVLSPVFVANISEVAVGFCLAIQPTPEDIGIIGQNFMTGYRMVFDWENMKLGWSHSNCQDLTDDKRMPMTPPNGSSPDPTTTEQQISPDSPAVHPAVAGRTPSKSTATSIFMVPRQYMSAFLLPFWLPACMFLWTF